MTRLEKYEITLNYYRLKYYEVESRNEGEDMALAVHQKSI